MTGTINRTPCPECGNVGSLNITTRLIGKPIGTYSLAGMQFKTSARFFPVLQCDHCTLDLVGEFDGEHHAVFASPKQTEA